VKKKIVALTALFAATFAIGYSIEGCNKDGPSPQTVTDVTIGLNAAICVINTYATDIAKGKSEADAIVDTAVKCGVSAAQAGGILAAHKSAETIEHPPAAAK
jgi:hypothetical protein